ncbi:hypothetical protein [Paraburkholderia bannensis]|uniref:hypothetical protein n=1 Tax=Paraburkholderia bannensis TaxID=765414 RepID=UPI002AB5FCBF|nr:hypothetical protein [Paraburkholderia bannensis]
MNHDTRNQAKAIQEQREKRPEPRRESGRDARLRIQIERERKERPMTGNSK